MRATASLVTLLLSGCGGTVAAPDASRPDAVATDAVSATAAAPAVAMDVPAAPTSPTWAEHVAPIVGARCAACHRADAIGGIALDTYASAAGFAPDIATEVRARLRAGEDVQHLVPAAVLDVVRRWPTAWLGG